MQEQINNQTNRIDISFLEEFIELIDKEEYCINAIKIYDLGIFANLERKSLLNKKGNFHSGRFYKDILNNKYIENVDYILAEISASISSGPKTLKTYMLKPECFKKILMRNQKTDTYANYYLFLEKILKYYSDYQKLKLKIENEKLQKIINTKEDKIDKLIKETQQQTQKIDQQSIEIKQQSIEIKELLKNSDKQLTEIEKTRQENEIINDKLNVVIEENEEINENIQEVTKKLDIAVEDRVVKPNNKKKEEVFVVIYNKQTGIYYIMCRQKETINMAIKKYIKENEGSEITHQINNPNCKNLLIRIKEKLSRKKQITFTNNSIKLVNIDENTFINKINKINNMKKEVIVDN